MPDALLAIGLIVAVIAAAVLVTVRERRAEEARDSAPAQGLPPGAWLCRGLWLSDVIDDRMPRLMCRGCKRFSRHRPVTAPVNAVVHENGSAWCPDRIEA